MEDKLTNYFEFDRPSPYMLFTAQVREDKRDVPAIAHVGGSARPQTICRDDHPFFYDLIQEFDRLTGCPVIINTSFNQRGEPIVCTPHDAFLCFMRTGMDFLVMGSFLLDKKQMDSVREKLNLAHAFQPD